jgi:hypothetical protein
MLTYVKVEDGVVVNRAVFDEPMPQDWPDYASWIENEDAQIGWTYDGTTFTGPPPAVDETIYAISNRQFYQQLALDGVITQQEALDAVRGNIPAPLGNAISTLTVGAEQFNASMFLASATLFSREHPVIEHIATTMGWTAEQTDELWRKARKLV